MKSFLRFLSNHKLYATIEVFGLSVAMAFVILLSSIIIEDNRTDAELGNMSDVFLVHPESGVLTDPEISPGFESLPAIESWCQVNRVRNDIYIGDLRNNGVLAVTDRFFDIFHYKMLEGDCSGALKLGSAVLLNDELARKLFPEGDALGKEVAIGYEQSPSRHMFTVSGIFREPAKTVMPKADIILTVPDGNFMALEDALYEGWGSDPNNQGNELVHIARVWPSVFNFVKIGDGVDMAALEEDILAYAKEHLSLFKQNIAKSICTTSYKKIHFGPKIYGTQGFRNLSDADLYRTFVYIGIILLLFAILNYISLTVAYSRFRMKEMASRRLLGAEKGETWMRSMAEAGMLVGVSFVIGLLLSFLLKNAVSSEFGLAVTPLGGVTDVLFALLAVVLISVVAGFVPGLLSSRYKPVDVLKGETRYQDKAILSKVFLGIQGALSVAVLAVAAIVFLQTRFMIKSDRGFRTDGVVIVNFKDRSDMRKMEIDALPCVSKTGYLVNNPLTSLATASRIQLGEEEVMVGLSMMDKDAMDILGIGFLDSPVKTASNNPGSIYLTESAWETVKPHVRDGVLESEKVMNIKGIVSSFYPGTAKNPLNYSMYGLWLLDNDQYMILCSNIVASVTGDENEAMDEIIKALTASGLEPDMFEVTSLNASLQEEYRSELRCLTIIAVFALLSIVLTALAIIAMSSYWVQLQTKDTSVRKVFGLSDKDVFLNTLKAFTIPMVLGVIAGIPLAYLYVGKWLANYPERISNTAWVYLVSGLLVLLVVIVSISIQAVRLMNTNPAEVLKKE